MSEKADKFVVFGEKFAKLDGEGQDRLVKAARELLKAVLCVKGVSSSPLFDEGRKARFAGNEQNIAGPRSVPILNGGVNNNEYP